MAQRISIKKVCTLVIRKAGTDLSRRKNWERTLERIRFQNCPSVKLLAPSLEALAAPLLKTKFSKPTWPFNLFRDQRQIFEIIIIFIIKLGSIRHLQAILSFLRQVYLLRIATISFRNDLQALAK